MKPERIAPAGKLFGAGMLKLSEEISKGIRDWGAKDYPNETCGAMLGSDDDNGREVRALFPLTNRRDDSPRNRFSITARTTFEPRKKRRSNGGWS